MEKTWINGHPGKHEDRLGFEELAESENLEDTLTDDQSGKREYLDTENMCLTLRLVT